MKEFVVAGGGGRGVRRLRRRLGHTEFLARWSVSKTLRESPEMSDPLSPFPPTVSGPQITDTGFLKQKRYSGKHGGARVCRFAERTEHLTNSRDNR